MTETVWVTKKGSVYHKHDPRHDSKHRGRYGLPKEAETITREEARRRGRVTCDLCYGKAEREKRLVTVDEFVGYDPDFSGGMTTEEHMDWLRGRR